MKLIELGAAAADRLDITAVARPVLRELSELGIGTSNLAILEPHEVLYVEKLNNPEHVIQIATRVGGTARRTRPPSERCWWRRPGRCWTALAGSARFHRAHGARSLRELGFERALRSAKQHGYALDEEEQNLRTVCVAAPIKNNSGSTVAAISLTCLSADVLPGRALQIAAVTDGAGRVSSVLGGLESRVVKNR